MSIKLVVVEFILCLAFCLLSLRLAAATPTASFSVTATVQASCLVSATSSPFGNYSPAMAKPKPKVSVTCTNASTPYIVDLRTGPAPGVAVSPLTMSDAVSTVVGHPPTSNFWLLVNRVQAKGFRMSDENENWSSWALSTQSQPFEGQYVAAPAFTDVVIVIVTY